MMKLKYTLVALAVTTVGANAAKVLSYESGISTTTENGAADPVSQGWSYSGSGSGYSDGYNAGNGNGSLDGGGWRTVDGTGGASSVYTHETASIIPLITAADVWKMSFTVALDKDAQRDGASNVANFYNAPNHGRQNAILLYFDMNDVDSFRVIFNVDATDQVVLNVSGNNYNTGVQLDEFGDYSITYDKALGTAVLDYGAGTAVINPSIADPNRSTLFMGSGSRGGMGSAVWNKLTIIAIPEPSSAALLGFGGLALTLRRRK